MCSSGACKCSFVQSDPDKFIYLLFSKLQCFLSVSIRKPIEIKINLVHLRDLIILLDSILSSQLQIGHRYPALSNLKDEA